MSYGVTYDAKGTQSHPKSYYCKIKYYPLFLLQVLELMTQSLEQPGNIVHCVVTDLMPPSQESIGTELLLVVAYSQQTALCRESCIYNFNN